MSRDLPPLNALRAFEATARLLSVTRAADELHVTHGAVSRQLRALEDRLGVTLLGKEGRGIKLTDAGVRLRDAAGEAFDRLALLCGELRRDAGEASFVVACPGSLLARWFIPRLDRLQRDLPGLRLQLSASEGELDPRRPGLDALLCFAAPPWPADVRVYELAMERIGPVVSPRHPRFADLQRASASELLDEPLLHTLSRPQAWPQWVAAQGLAEDRLSLGQGFEHLYYSLEAAIAGQGIAVAPQLLVADELKSGRLEAPWGFVETHARLALWVPSQRTERAGAEAQRLARWLADELAEGQVEPAA
ncbi:LysR family transcriptional regulator [Pseudomonas sp. RIT-PI-AD]|uniref:LysR family transcriptional regulator n=1 Tax=Pseudomonas sp. RIT-PI-AD TaxID=3035294 RepID=UPI0021D8A3BE|nr:LysR family transcriptional regulator [Pseudomonas sp. RIT-PI-AD]